MNVARALEERFNTKLDVNSKESLMDSFTKVEFKKGDFVLKKGEIERYLYFVEAGILRFWIYDTNFNEVTFQFAFPNELTNGYKSLITSTPVEFNIQAVVKSTLWKLPASVMHELYNTSLSINVIARKIMEDIIFNNKINREILLTAYKAADRYRIIAETSDLINLVPLKDLASYMGVTKQTLIRIKKDYLKNK